MSGPMRRRREPPETNSEKKLHSLKSSNKLHKLPRTTKKSSQVNPLHNLSTKRTTRASKKIQEQDENNVTHVAKVEIVDKEGLSNRISTLRSNFLKYDTNNKKPVLPVKFPVLRDRTNVISDFSKTNLSSILARPTIKKRATSKKLELIVSSSDQPTSGINSKASKKESLQKTEISKESVLNSLLPLQQIQLRSNDFRKKEMRSSVQRVPKTRSAQGVVERNPELSAPFPKTKKFFKSGNSNNKPTILVKKESVNGVGRKRKRVKKTTTNDSSCSFVATTPEKCSDSEKKTLRPRQKLKNYCEESKLLNQLSPEKRKSVVFIEKMSDPNGKKLPIWKSVKFLESERKGIDVYEILDGDLSNEEPRPKKKKRARKPVKRLKKSVQSVKTEKSIKTTKKTKSAKLIEKASDKLSEEISKEIQDVPKLNSQVHPKPKMVSMEILDNTQKVNIVQTPLKPEAPKEFRPFRVTQIFQHRPTMKDNMSDHSLLSRSMSPIAKLDNNFNSATPWRIPNTESFSCVRNLVQSTPRQNKEKLDRPKLGSLVNKTRTNEKPTMNRIDEEKSENVEEAPNNPKSMSGSDKIIEKNGNSKTENESIGVINPEETAMQNSIVFSEYVEDKENTAPNYQSPQKSPMKYNNWIETPKTPQPGPSGLQRQPLQEAKIFRQTNLNNFLNLYDTPERTQMRSVHGIFNDVHSTPINGKPLKKITEDNVQNAFGFEDDDFDYDIDVSPIASENVEPVILPLKEVLEKKRLQNRNTERKSMDSNPLRLSTKGILKTLHKRRIAKEIMDKEQRNEINIEKNLDQENKESKENKKEAQENDNMEIVKSTKKYSDTFDLLDDLEIQKSEETDKNEVSSVSLFEDLEPPTHFATPPVRIYKRKRGVQFDLSEETDDKEDDDVEVKRVKKKSKKASQKDKKLEEWAKNINKTFEEIDNFDLVVE